MAVSLTSTFKSNASAYETRASIFFLNLKCVNDYNYLVHLEPHYEFSKKKNSYQEQFMFLAGMTYLKDYFPIFQKSMNSYLTLPVRIDNQVLIVNHLYNYDIVTLLHVLKIDNLKMKTFIYRLILKHNSPVG